jgi:hypothetical protein
VSIESLDGAYRGVGAPHVLVTIEHGRVAFPEPGFASRRDVELLRFFDIRDVGFETVEAAIETSAGQHVTARWRCGEPLSVCTGGVCVEPLVPPPSPTLRGVELLCP